MNKIFFMLGLVLFANNIQAAGWYTATINRIQVQSGKSLSLVVNQTQNHECGSKSLRLLDSNSPGADWIYSFLLANQSKKRKVQFFIVSCSGTQATFDRVEDID